MIDYSNFKIWLNDNTKYSDKTISNIVSRLKRANTILPWYDDAVYLFLLEQEDQYQELSSAVKSQIKKAVKLYNEYINTGHVLASCDANNRIKVLSLFANIGVAEAYLDELGFDVFLANELIERRAKLYSRIYPNTHMICGDITDDTIKNTIISESQNTGVDIIIATPPCQGMSTAGQQIENDLRNRLICPVVDIIHQTNPKYVFIENVPQFLNTEIDIDGETILIPRYLDRELSDNYQIKTYVIDTKDYSVPQTRERAILLLTRNDINAIWTMPPKDQKIVTMRDAIGDLPSIDPFVTDVSSEELTQMFPLYEKRKEVALSISKWNIPPHHVKRQVVAMQHTPSGCTAFDNQVFVPTKENGEPVKGYHNTYKRQNWDTPAYTVTMDNRKISSQNNVHPGRLEGKDEDGNDIYSDARTLTLFELMLIMSLPENWPIPDDTSEAFLRRIIGEGIPPLFVKKVFENLKKEIEYAKD